MILKEAARRHKAWTAWTSILILLSIINLTCAFLNSIPSRMQIMFMASGVLFLILGISNIYLLFKLGKGQDQAPASQTESSGKQDLAS